MKYLESGKHPSSSFSYDHLGPQLMKLFPKWFRFEGGPRAYKGGVKRPLRANLRLRRIRAVLGRMMIAVMMIVVVAVVAAWLDGGRRGRDGSGIRGLACQRGLPLRHIRASGSLHPSRRL